MTSTHDWLLFFTTAGRVYRTKAYNLPEAARDAKGGHVAGLLSFQPDESIAQVDADGMVTGKGRGDTHVIAFYDSAVAAIQALLPLSDRMGPRYPNVPTPGAVGGSGTSSATEQGTSRSTASLPRDKRSISPRRQSAGAARPHRAA